MFSVYFLLHYNDLTLDKTRPVGSSYLLVRTPTHVAMLLHCSLFRTHRAESVPTSSVEEKSTGRSSIPEPPSTRSSCTLPIRTTKDSEFVRNSREENGWCSETVLFLRRMRAVVVPFFFPCGLRVAKSVRRRYASKCLAYYVSVEFKFNHGRLS